MATKYNNESITALKGADRVRKRPAVIFGSDGIEGCQHSTFEILSNSIDEAREGYGNEITLVRHSDLSISVIDNGRGIPVEYNKNERKYNWELVFCELYAGGKYNTNNAENYEYSLGLNGLGLCATQYSSEYMNVVVVRDGYEYAINFKKGHNADKLKKKKVDKSRKTGSKITWRPDLDVFTDINISSDYFTDVIKKQAIVNKGIKFIYKDEILDYEEVFLYENGIEDYIDELSEGKEFSEIIKIEGMGRGKDREDKPEYKVKIELAMTFNNENKALLYFHNSSFLEHGGSPDKAVKSALVYEIDKQIKNMNKYTKNEKKITFVDIEDSLILISNSFSTTTSYENQTKKSITNKFIQSFMTDLIKEKLEIYFIENKNDTEKIINQILVNKRSREKAEITRQSLKKKLSVKNDIVNKVKKFVDCRTKDIDKRELFIVEGDSALGACKMARNAEFQAIIPVRGKILNTLKADYEKIFKSDIIMDLVKVLGCGIEIKTKHAKDFNLFDIGSLQYDKIIITTDADVDGFQIRTLILTMIYSLAPSLISEGKVFIAESPLYEIISKEKSYFAYDEVEKSDIIKNLDDRKYKIHRSKGLGENEPEMLWLTTMNPETRRVIKVTEDDVKATKMMFETLLGDDILSRKRFIKDNGPQYTELLDLN
ncbi:MAG: toprim domain-containing protein [Bacillota bacterium]|nr:toprim domain-containing protein [Bacillota bacterium]